MGRSRDQTHVVVGVRVIKLEAEWGTLNRPLVFFHAAAAISSALCTACSPGTYSGSAGARAWARVKSEIWASQAGVSRIYYLFYEHVSYVLVSHTHSHFPVSVGLSLIPPIPQSKHHAASPDVAEAYRGWRCLQHGLHLRHVWGHSLVHTPAILGRASAPTTGKRSGRFVSPPGPSMVTESILTASST